MTRQLDETRPCGIAYKENLIWVEKLEWFRLIGCIHRATINGVIL